MLEIINQRYMKFLFEIDNKKRNISELAKINDLTLSVASTLISRWAYKGVVLKVKPEGRKETTIILTNYGQIQVNLLKEMNKNYLKHSKKTSDGGEK